MEPLPVRETIAGVGMHRQTMEQKVSVVLHAGTIGQYQAGRGVVGKSHCEVRVV
ncbi:MAG: hypothetical protein OXS35_03475 [Dehalococcoidia bacterium]|nr:hypothetical protein [Dehalococcoidia bacterium]